MRKDLLNTVKIDESKCTGCGLCADACPLKAITLEVVAKIDEGLCRGCCVCMDECPNDAIYLVKKEPLPAFQHANAPGFSRISSGPVSGCFSRLLSDTQGVGFQQTASVGGALKRVCDFSDTPSPSRPGRRQGTGRGLRCGLSRRQGCVRGGAGKRGG